MPRPSSTPRSLAPLLAVLAAAACSGGVDTVHILEYAEIGLPGEAGGAVVIDAHQGGRGQSLGLAHLAWGRLVDVYDLHPGTGATTLRYVDFPVGPDLVSDGFDYQLERAPVTARDVLTLLHPYGSPGWSAALERAEASLVELEATEAGPTLPGERPVPRDAVLVARFDDLLDEATLDALVLEVDGLPLAAPRIEADANHGGWLEVDGRARFFPTRVLVDLAVTPLDAARSRRVVDGSPAGLPAPARRGLRNVTLRSVVLANLAGRSLRGPVAAFEAASPDQPFGGLLPAVGDPRLLGDQAITLIRASLKPNGEFLLAWKMGTPACLTRVAVGDLVTLPGALLEVVAGSTPVYKPVRGIAGNVRARLVAGNASNVVLGAALYTSPFTAGQNDPPECFVRFTPQPGSPPAAGVDPQSILTLRFSEPMDATTFEGLDTFTVRRTAPGGVLEEHVIGTVTQSAGGTEMIFVPSLALTHVAGQAESYLVTLSDSVRSLGGVSLLDGLPPTAFGLDPAAATQDTGGLSLRFGAVDEDGDGNPEVRGQVLYDLSDRRLQPRPVTRFSAVADPTVPIVGSMVQFTAPIQTPLSNLGSRMMTTWRHHDLGFGLLDESTHNVDVEGLAWMPFATAGLQIDDFTEFEMALAHSLRLPDEALTTGLLPQFTLSGVLPKFADNVLDPTNDPLTIVHPRLRGYQVRDSDTFISSSGNRMAPWPLNRNLPAGQSPIHWTFRDTSVLAVGGPNGAGSDTKRFNQITVGGMVGFYRPDEVPTIGLPLLMDFKTWPDSQASGLNGFLIAIAINSSAKPFFRSFSTGGVRANGTVKLVQPDQAIVADGGLSPATGAATPPQDNAFYYGQADFVIRISRMHTTWFDTGSASPIFATAVIEPPPALQPSGTRVEVHWRGATGLTASGPYWADARNFGPYGDSYTARQNLMLGRAASLVFDPIFLNGDSGWKDLLTDLDGARWIQARVSFVSDPASGRTPELSALGLPFSR